MDSSAPMKVIPIVTNIFKCPKCKKPIYLPSPKFNPDFDASIEMAFCNNCGQKLDWTY